MIIVNCCGTVGCCTMKRIDDRYLHPLLHRKPAVPKVKASIIRNGSLENNVDRISSSLNITKPSAYPHGYVMVATDEKSVGGPISSNIRHSNGFNGSVVPDTPGAYSNSSQKPLLYRLPSYPAKQQEQQQ